MITLGVHFWPLLEVKYHFLRQLGHNQKLAWALKIKLLNQAKPVSIHDTRGILATFLDWLWIPVILIQNQIPSPLRAWSHLRMTRKYIKLTFDASDAVTLHRHLNVTNSQRFSPNSQIQCWQQKQDFFGIQKNDCITQNSLDLFLTYIFVKFTQLTPFKHHKKCFNIFALFCGCADPMRMMVGDGQNSSHI